MDKIKVGDLVRSFDFDGGRDLVGLHACFVEGYVVDITTSDVCPCYIIRVDREIWDGKLEFTRIDTEVSTPVNGTPTSSGRICDFVKLIELAKYAS